MSAVATKATVRTPWAAPGAYLQGHNWVPMGDPDHPSCRWLDPQAPEKATERKVRTGMQKLPNGREEEVYQVHVTPARIPMPRDEAMMVQMARDEAGSK